VPQGSEITINVTHDGDLETTVHWHRLRLDNRYAEMLLAKLDELVAKVVTLLAEIRTVTEQLEAELARSCPNALTMADVMVDEIRLRAHARPLEEPEP
jgi:vacuolar-type H+-ATPase subunit D/Vma8